MAPSCASDVAPTREEAQLWRLLGDDALVGGDAHPDAHAVRLRLTLATAAAHEDSDGGQSVGRMLAGLSWCNTEATNKVRVALRLGWLVSGRPRSGASHSSERLKNNLNYNPPILIIPHSHTVSAWFSSNLEVDCTLAQASTI